VKVAGESARVSQPTELSLLEGRIFAEGEKSFQVVKKKAGEGIAGN